VHLHDAPAPRPLVEAVHVLGRQQEAVAQALLECGERPVRRVRRGRLGLRAALRVEAPDERGVGGEAPRRGDALHRLAVPQPARAAKRGQPRLGGNARACHDQDAGVLVDDRALHVLLLWAT